MRVLICDMCGETVTGHVNIVTINKAIDARMVTEDRPLPRLGNQAYDLCINCTATVRAVLDGRSGAGEAETKKE